MEWIKYFFSEEMQDGHQQMRFKPASCLYVGVLKKEKRRKDSKQTALMCVYIREREQHKIDVQTKGSHADS